MQEKSSIGFSGFEKLAFLVEVSKFSEMSKISENSEGGAPALRVIRAGTRLTVHRSLPWLVEWKYSSFSKSNTETLAKPGRLGPAQNNKPMRNLSSYQGFARWHDEKCTGFVVERISKINMDMIKARERNEKHRFYEVPDFQKFRKKGNFKENIENFRIF